MAILHIRKLRGSQRLSNLPKDRTLHGKTRLSSQAIKLQTAKLTILSTVPIYSFVSLNTGMIVEELPPQFFLSFFFKIKFKAQVKI